MKLVYEYGDIIEALESGIEWEEYDIQTKTCFFEKEYVKLKKKDLAFLLECIKERNEELKVLKSMVRQSGEVWEAPVKPCKVDELIASAKEELEEEAYSTFKEKMKELEEER